MTTSNKKRSVWFWVALIPLLGLGSCIVGIATCGLYVRSALTGDDDVASTPPTPEPVDDKVAAARAAKGDEERAQATVQLIASVSAELVQPEALMRAEQWYLADESLRRLEERAQRFKTEADAGPLFKKLEKYRTKIDRQVEALRKQEAVDVARRGERPYQSEYSKKVTEVEIYLSRVLNDPGSYEHQTCSDVVGTGNFWVVECSYRARNRFGAMVLDAQRFFIRHGQVVRAKPL